MASEQVLDTPARRHVFTSERPFQDVLDGIYGGISQPDIRALFARLAACTSYEEFTALVGRAQGSAGLMRFLHLDDDHVLALDPQARVVFLHGHQLERNLARAVTAEALAVPVAGGLALAIAVASIGHISGAHLNPAVTLGLAVNRRFPWAYAPGYVIAQLAGAITAAAVTWGLYGNHARSIVRLGATIPAAGVSAGRVLAAEAIVTLVLVLMVVAVATDTRVPRGIAALAIGAALAVAIVISGPVSGAGVNPARALGPMILAGQFTDWWAYLAAPLAAGLVAVALYDRLLRAGTTPA